MLDGLFNKLKKGMNIKQESVYAPVFNSIEACIAEKQSYFYSHSRLPFNDCDGYQELKKLKGQAKVDALIALIERINLYEKKNYKHGSREHNHYVICKNLLDAFMRTRFDFPEDFSFVGLCVLLYEETDRLYERPIGSLIIQIEKQVKAHNLTQHIRSEIESLLDAPLVKQYVGEEATHSYWGGDMSRAVKKLKRLLHAGDENGDVRVPAYELGSGCFGSVVKRDIEALPEEEQDKWHTLFHHLATASSGKPSRKFIDIANPLVDALGSKQFKTFANKWFDDASHIEVNTISHTNSHNGREYTYNTHEYIEAYSHNLLKGLLWSMSRFHDATSLQTIALLVEKCFQKIPGQGPAAAGVGNSGIYTLAQSKGLAGISHLSRLKLRIRQNNTQTLIQKYIDEQAARLGITPSQVEELSAQDFGLTEGQRVETFNDYQLKLSMTGVGASELEWFKPDGKPQKTVPAFVKNSASLSAKLKKMRDIAKQVKQASTTQRDRIDRLYTENMSWNLENFNQYYLNHGLVSQITRKLIWNMDEQPALYVDGQWQDVNGEPLTVNADVTIRLWHPIDSAAETVLAWRDRLETLQIKQPLKQVYREIYILTDAELNTRIYSNRMAAHILKQHQFNSLAALRGWKYSLLGAYDDGRDGEIALKQLPAYNIKAQFWINEIIDDTDSFNDAGIWYYVATDQVRFSGENDEDMALLDVPPLVFSEIMRDVDLFVGVASVGNDPQWQDGGPNARPDYRQYWQSYSFGDLSEVAKTRKSVLERLLPRLKIRDVASIDGKFLIVKGKRNTYKIHIGSGNILIAPHDRYLCIVPSRAKDRNLNQVFLPFEGDSGLSIVLSKAFLLAEDDKIKDSTILSQL